MKRLALLIAIVILISKAQAFEGYELYPLDGNTIFPLEDVNVRLSEIFVSIDGETGKVNSKFMLENIGDKTINFKVAFPILSACVNNCTQLPDDFKVTIGGKVAQISTISMNDDNFFARVRRKVSSDIAHQFKPSDEKAYIWDVSLKANEKKAIICTYSTWWYLQPPQEMLLFNLMPGILWTGNIDKVYFKVAIRKVIMTAISSGRAKLRIAAEKYSKRTNNAIEWRFSDLNLKNIERIERIGIYVWYKGSGE